MDTLTYAVPSGIGDVSWLYSKLLHAGSAVWEVSDGWPYRTKPYLELLPHVNSVSYGMFSYQDICNMWHMHGKSTWKETTSNGLSRLFIEVNSWLERGNRLEDWMPDLPTEFHYEIPTSQRSKDLAQLLLKDLPRPLWGISAASYRGSEAWKTWGYDEWSTFLKALVNEVGGTPILLGGFWDDLTAALARDGYPDLVGKTDIACAVDVLRELRGYIGFSSGLGVIMTVLNRPTFMMWPDHQQPLRDSWAPMHMLESGKYVAMPWMAPDIVIARALDWVDDTK